VCWRDEMLAFIKEFFTFVIHISRAPYFLTRGFEMVWWFWYVDSSGGIGFDYFGLNLWGHSILIAHFPRVHHLIPYLEEL
jgi:hypothetical protein